MLRVEHPEIRPSLQCRQDILDDQRRSEEMLEQEVAPRYSI